MLDIQANLAVNQLNRLMFLGTPDFAAIHLRQLIDAGENVIAVVTQQDKPAHRGQKETPPPVKELALEAGIPVHQPANKLELEHIVLEINPDVLVVVAFGMLITPAIVNRYLCLNVHGSLLPKYRGAAPVQYAVLNGDAQSGVSIMVLDEKMDTGPLVLSQPVDVLPQHTSSDLFNALSLAGPQALMESLRLLRRERDQFQPLFQDETQASYTHKLAKSDGLLDPARMTPADMVRRVKAYNPWPGAYLDVLGQVVKIINADIDASGKMQILDVQPANKKKMTYSDYLRGNPPILTK